MIYNVVEIILLCFAVIGLYKTILQLCKTILTKTTNVCCTPEIRIVINSENRESVEFMIRNLISVCDSGILRNAEIVLIDNGMGPEAKKICQIFESSVHKIKIEKKT